MAASPRLTIAHVTPYTWGPHDEVNEFVGETAAELAERGHRVVVAAPVTTRKAVRDSRRGIERARDESFAAIHEMLELKRRGDIRGVIVSGCLAGVSFARCSARSLATLKSC